MKSIPTISVLMSVFNGEKYIRRSLLSILSQTFMDFEIILIDDGSNDGTLDVVRTISDSRLKVVSQENQGLTRSLNIALGMARGRWIARQDADDFSIYNRFERQISFLKKHPQVGLLGSSVFIQPEFPGFINEVYAYPCHESEILSAFHLCNPFVHGSTMVDKKLMMKVGGYNEAYRYVQDYELWSRLINLTRVRNLSNPLYVRSVHSSASQITVDKEAVFNEIRQTHRKNYPRIDPPQAEARWPIRSISLYPAITSKHSWNRSIACTYSRMAKSSFLPELSRFVFYCQAIVYHPWSLRRCEEVS